MSDILRFEDFTGQDALKSYLKETAVKNRPPHALIIEGDRGTGKRTLSKLFAMALLCEDEGDKPCLNCRSCKLAKGNNHPDIITLQHEKPNLISVDEVRKQIVGDVLIRPYYNKRKIYIIPDSEKIHINGQNALLKTIEEPPEYAVIILLTQNKNALLPTILSRCTAFSMNPLSDQTVAGYLINKLDIKEDKARVSASLARGSIGRAADMAESEEFGELYENTLEFMKNAEKKELFEIFSAAKELSSRKEDIETIMDLMLLWYRDMLMCKASDNTVALTFTNETGYIVSKAQKYSYEEINNVFNTLEKTRERLQHNANAEASMDMLLMSAAGR